MGEHLEESEHVFDDEPCTPPACKRPRLDQSDLTSVKIDQSDLTSRTDQPDLSAIRTDQPDLSSVVTDQPDLTTIRTDQSDLTSISDQLLSIEHRMCEELDRLKFSLPVTHIYNPLDYAAETHQSYVHRYGNSKKRVLFLGMNPGPFGMAQNGVGELLCMLASEVYCMGDDCSLVPRPSPAPVFDRLHYANPSGKAWERG